MGGLWDESPNATEGLSEADKGKSRCSGFHAKLYITSAAFEKYPALKECAPHWKMEVVDELPKLQPYERALDWIAPTGMERSVESCGSITKCVWKLIPNSVSYTLYCLATVFFVVMYKFLGKRRKSMRP